jgi:uncharacterized delta-60 repeat protein
VTAFPGSFAFVNALLLQPDGRIVAVGGTASDEFALARYDADGSLDESFGSGGLVVTPVGFGGYAFAAALQADGRIVVVGQVFPRLTPQGYDVDFIAARYMPDGTLDTSFGSGGIVLTDFQLVDIAHAVAVQADQKLVIAGVSLDGSGGGTLGDFALVRLNTDGSLDASFGNSGKVLTDFPDASGSRSDIANAVAVQANGTILAGGTSWPQGGSLLLGSAFALARFTPSGTPDPAFGNDGRVTTDFGTGYADDDATSMALTPGGQIVLGGSSGVPAFPTTVQDFALARYNANGGVDATFGSGGTIVTDFGAVDTARGVAVQSDTKIVAAGITSASSTGGSTTFATARYDGGSATASEMITALIALVDSYDVAVGSSLQDKLVSVQRSLDANRPKQACDTLRAFENQVAAQSGKALTAPQAASVASGAAAVKRVIGCT